MTLERCYSSIDRYLNREDESAPRFVNVESVEDMVAIVDHYNVGENIFLTVEKYSSEDENPRIEDLKYLSDWIYYMLEAHRSKRTLFSAYGYCPNECRGSCRCTMFSMS